MPVSSRTSQCRHEALVARPVDSGSSMGLYLYSPHERREKETRRKVFRRPRLLVSSSLFSSPPVCTNLLLLLPLLADHQAPDQRRLGRIQSPSWPLQIFFGFPRALLSLFSSNPYHPPGEQVPGRHPPRPILRSFIPYWTNRAAGTSAVSYLIFLALVPAPLRYRVGLCIISCVEAL